jgi:hypothetical protein
MLVSPFLAPEYVPWLLRALASSGLAQRAHCGQPVYCVQALHYRQRTDGGHGCFPDLDRCIADSSRDTSDKQVSGHRT